MCKPTEIQDFNILTKNVNTRMADASKNLATKNHAVTRSTARNILEDGSKSSKASATWLASEENFGLWNNENGKFPNLFNEISRPLTCRF